MLLEIGVLVFQTNLTYTNPLDRNFPFYGISLLRLRTKVVAPTQQTTNKATKSFFLFFANHSPYFQTDIHSDGNADLNVISAH